jgi:hypothetical protein
LSSLNGHLPLESELTANLVRIQVFGKTLKSSFSNIRD